MKPELALNEREALKAQLCFQRVSNLGLVAAMLLLLLMFGVSVIRERIYIVPPEVQRPYEIGAHHGNREYLSDMAHYVLDKILTVTPENVDYNNQVILKMVHPEGAASVRTTLDAAAKRLKKERVTTVWIPQTEAVDERTHRVSIHGKLKTFISDKLTSEKEKFYQVQLKLTLSGRLYVLQVEEVGDGSASRAGA